MDNDATPPLSTCFGGGGSYGIGFNMGVADGLRDVGVNVAEYAMIGTSAGSMAAAALATGLSFEELADVWADRVKNKLRPMSWRASELMEPLFGSSRPPVDNVVGVAVSVRSFRRKALSGHQYRLADITAASSSITPIARPHRIDGHAYIDGGFRSMASADLAEPAAQLILVTPFSNPRQGPAGRLGQRQAAREIRRWVTRANGAVFHLRPDAAMSRITSYRPSDLGDIRIARQVYPLARDLGRQVGERINVATDRVNAA